MLAIEMGADAADIGLTIHPHPTLSETVAMAAEAFDGTLTDLYVPRKTERRKHDGGEYGECQEFGCGGAKHWGDS